MKEDVKKILSIAYDHSTFWFYKDDLLLSKTLPDYWMSENPVPRIIENDDYDFYELPVNIITINKTIQEFYAIGKWCGLWE